MDSREQHVRAALLTAPPFAGKTTLSRRIERELHLPVLDCDSDVFCRGFRILGQPGLGQAIKPLGAWAHLRKDSVFDELYSILRRDWFVMAGSPRAFVATGWIYCFREWRDQVRRAFAAITDLNVQIRLFVLRLSHEEFFARYGNAQKERFGNGYGYFDKTPAQQRKQSDEHYNEFLQRELEVSQSDEIQCVQGSDEELVRGIAAFCK
jgi:hypothetical protein